MTLELPTAVYSAFGLTPLFEPPHLAALVKTLISSDVGPTHWSTSDGGAKTPIAVDDIVSVAHGVPSTIGMFLSRRSSPKTDVDLDLGRRPSVTLQAFANGSEFQGIAGLSHTLDSVFHPDLSACWTAQRTQRPWENTLERDLAVIVTGSYLGSYHRLGPQALGTRTTFGPHYVEQFGRERLLSTPVHVTELDWGGIQLDLVEEPWTASMEDLVGAWRRGMEHLAPAGIFAEVQIDEERKRIRYLRKGPNVVIGGVLPKES